MSAEFEPFDLDGDLTVRQFKAFLRHVTLAGASDILIQSGDHAWVEIHGRQVRASTSTLKHGLIGPLIEGLFGSDVVVQVGSGHPVDRSLQMQGIEDGLERGQVMRFRVNVVQAVLARLQKGYSITMRTIPQDIPDIHKQGVDDELLAEMYPAKGLVLVCGPTGSGKSTFLAGIYANAGMTMPDRKVITCEDPVEFVLGGQHWKGPQPAQSEIGRDFGTFAESLRAAMRRKPSIVGIGEIRDLETIDAAIEVGLTGHLCLATMHTDSVPETINRAIQIYPPAQQAAVASRLLGAIRVIVVQRLLKTTDGRRTAIREYLVFDREVRDALSALPYDQWARYMRHQLEAKQGTLDDKAWALLQAGRIPEAEFVELAGAKALRSRQAFAAESEAA
ncbi:plasmid transfer ATPase TraJ [Dyella ginsengisoli]|uniref:plasmid transfer ATPase TraJ n=1 Tax=Dyella ginsengisoli TaxID=363848 RepID=UPI00034763C1|nr:plasmid transfer ATPase TraJ [Dyella ginsengisoli]